MSENLRFRQIHLDFHTSEAINNIGSRFNKEQFQEMLKLGHVDSITIFAKCHHGWAYHDTQANERHPGLNFDLLKAQIEAAHEIDVNTPVYISAGLDEKIARRHPDWLLSGEDREFNQIRFHVLCMNSPYLDYLTEQVKEVVSNYDADGIFLDIVGVRECRCKYCTKLLLSKGLDPNNDEHWQKIYELTYKNYYETINKAIRSISPDMRIFHNGGHIRCGRRDLAYANTHLELESLPTGGYDYQHFPLSARYVHHLDMDYMGMTGKFHTTWGEFGGYKHPNALWYENSLSIANGARCSIGDQLHPYGDPDYATYDLIGRSYAEVEKKEPWCVDIEPVADIAFLNVESINLDEENKHASANYGCIKMLLEGKYLYDVIDTQVDFNKYKLIILPDIIRINDKLNKFLTDYVNNGGKILASGVSGLYETKEEFAFDFGCKYLGINEYSPTFYYPDKEYGSLKQSGYVVYGTAHKIENTKDSHIIGYVQNPFFNREKSQFCSHQHFPSTQINSYGGISTGKDGAYIAWNVFSQYYELGAITLKEMVHSTIDYLIADKLTLKTNLPVQGVVTLNYQPKHKRYVTHLLYASPVLRGYNKKIEIIEDIVPIYDINVDINLDEKIKNVYLAPQNTPIDYTVENGVLSFKLDKLCCHQMVVIDIE